MPESLDLPDLISSQVTGDKETQSSDLPSKKVSNISRVICAAVLSTVIHVGICSKVADYMSSPSADAVVLVDGRSFNKNKFVDLVKRNFNQEEKFSESLSGKEFFFTAELFELIDILGESKAMERSKVARHRYQNLVKKLFDMKERGVKRQEIYNYLIQLQGDYKQSSSFVTNLLYNGSGNCEARAKLMTMALEEVFKGEIEVKVEITNIKNLENGEIIPHISVIVKDNGEHYYMELPEVSVLSDKQLNKITVFGPEIFNRAYLVEEGEEQYSEGELRETKNEVDSAIETDSIFRFPNSSSVKKRKGFGFGDADRSNIFNLDDNQISILFVPGLKLNVDDIKPERSDYSDFTYLDEETARVLVRSGGDGIDLSGLSDIDPEVLKILSGFEGNEIKIRIGRMNKESAELLSNFKCERLKIKADVGFESARELSKFKGEYLVIYGELKSPEAAVELAKFKGGCIGIESGVDKEIAKALSLFKGFKLVVGDEVDRDAAEELSKFGGDLLLIIGVVGAEAAVELSKFKGWELAVNGSSTPETAENFSGFKGGGLIVGGKQFVQKSADKFSNFKGNKLRVEGNFGPKVAKAFSKFNGELLVVYMEELKEEVAREFAKFGGHELIIIANVESKAAKELSKFKGKSLEVRGNVKEAAIEELEKFRGKLLIK